MSTSSLGTAFGALRSRRSVPWLTVAALAAVMAYADGFWLTALQVTVGSIERVHEPFLRWLRDSTLMVPVFGIAVLWALSRAQRRYGARINTVKAVAVTSLLIALAGTVVGIAQTAASSAYDYRLQAQQLNEKKTTHLLASHQQHIVAGRVAVAPCDVTCLEKRATLASHVQGLVLVSGIYAGTNLLLVGWVVAMRGAELSPRRKRIRVPAAV